jgi:hypothetical protein
MESLGLIIGLACRCGAAKIGAQNIASNSARIAIGITHEVRTAEVMTATVLRTTLVNLDTIGSNMAGS